jgi:hypothetical protein
MDRANQICGDLDLLKPPLFAAKPLEVSSRLVCSWEAERIKLIFVDGGGIGINGKLRCLYEQFS